MTLPRDPRASAAAWRLVAKLFVATVVAGAFQASGVRIASPVGAAFVPCGFALLALVSILGDTEPPARPLALVLLAATISALAMGSLALVVLHVVEAGSLGQRTQDVEFIAGGEARLSFMMALLALSGAATMLALFGLVRRAVRDIIPIDPDRFSHAIALAVAVAAVSIPLLPLFVLGHPPLPLPPNALPPGASPVAVPSFAERSIELAWFAVAAIVVARGRPRRPWTETCARLGVHAPAWQMALLAAALGMASAWAWPHAGAVVGRWVAPAATAPPVPVAWLPGGGNVWPLAALSVLTAAGTELLYRGLLQPRLGLVLTNLVLAAPLAWTAGWSNLFPLFGLGLLLGWLRVIGGTVASAVAHLAFLWALLGRGPY